MALNISEAEIARIVKSVVSSMPAAGSAKVAENAEQWDSKSYHGRQFIGIFDDMNEAIIAANAGYKAVRNMTVEQREKIITEIRRLTREEAEIMGKLGVAETGMGRADHKTAKHILVANKTPEPRILLQTQKPATTDLLLLRWRRSALLVRLPRVQTQARPLFATASE